MTRESDWWLSRGWWRINGRPSVSNSDNKARICPSPLITVILPCKWFAYLLIVPCPWYSIDRRSPLVGVARRSRNPLPKWRWRLNSIQTDDHHAPRLNPLMSVILGVIGSTHLTLSTVIPNINTVEGWKAQGLRIETRIARWIWRWSKQSLYLNQQKYKAIFTPKYSRISSRIVRTGQ